MRQFALNLFTDEERFKRGMPPRQTARGGLGFVGKAGYEWQDLKVSELDKVFGNEHIFANPQKVGGRPGTLDLLELLPLIKPYQFIVEGRYDANTQTFREAFGVEDLRDLWDSPLSMGNAFPDIIQIMPPLSARPNWELEKRQEGYFAYEREVLPTGEIKPFPVSDDRLRLRVIDIKLSSEPGASYFAEVVYYSVTLSAWLVEKGWSDRFVVVAAPAVWPGSYETSKIIEARAACLKEGRDATIEELARALEDDIEIAPFEVFSARLRRVFQEELPFILRTDWQDLPWHVSYICKGCDFLGYPWIDKDGKPTNDELHCWVEAEKLGHLSRVTGLTKGGAKLLQTSVASVQDLAVVPETDSVFELSPTLRAKRTIFPARAISLCNKDARVITRSGGDALMPQWPDLHIYIFVDYDLASAVTVSFGIRAAWFEPFNSGATRKIEKWSTESTGRSFEEVYVVDRNRPENERDGLRWFLRMLRRILDHVIKTDQEDISSKRRDKNSTYQIYLWDEAQRKHLARVIGRHLGSILADPKLRGLAWLFPPSELLVHPEDASYRSPFTLVSNVVQNVIAVPVPHHYTLLEVVKSYRLDKYSTPTVHPLYQEPFSDLIPGERIHELWNRPPSVNWLDIANIISETTQKKLGALALVTARLEKDLKPLLNRASAPPVVRAPDTLTNVSRYSQLWYEYTRLNAALDDLDKHTVRAMPPHEREARFKSAYLTQRLEGGEMVDAYHALQATAQQTLPRIDQLLIYRLSSSSVEFNVRPPSLGYAVVPRSDPTFLNKAAYPLVKEKDIKTNGPLKGSVADAGLTQVSIVAIDRINALIALKRWYSNCMTEMESAQIADFSQDVMLDPVGTDFLSKKIKLTMSGIGNPPSAQRNSATLRALEFDVQQTTSTPESPSSEFLWKAPELAQVTIDRELSLVRNKLEETGIRLDDSQWKAWEASLTRRLALIWGPPGTGKSKTLRAVIAGAMCIAKLTGTNLRILIASSTYAAVDNVLLETAETVAQIFPKDSYKFFRLQSEYSSLPAELEEYPSVSPVTVKIVSASSDVLELQEELNNPKKIVLVAGPSQQLHNLAIATKNKRKNEKPERTQRRWFDLIIIDEASQMDVAESTLIVSKASEGASFILAGDDKQLPPIHPALPPKDLEYVVGSVYNFMRYYHRVPYQPLQTNYRSCQTLVDFIKLAGYDQGLTAYHKNLRLNLLNGAPTTCPEDWPNELFWTPEWKRFLDPTEPTTCFIYEDESAGQANDFEADAVASLVRLLYGRLDTQLVGELDIDGSAKLATGKTYGANEFWAQAIGVVTPHRAQMSKIVARLQQVFPSHDAGSIWSAVDTVERFQGQQRDIIIASFGLGDPDLIRLEDEFLYSLNRFNVMASRSRAKLIVFTTRSLIDHLSNDIEILEESRLLKSFAESFCQNPVPMKLGYQKNGEFFERSGVFRAR